MKDKLTDSNFPKTEDGRTYHLSVRSGEVANRIITVGDPARARTIATYLDEQQDYRTFAGPHNMEKMTVDPTTGQVHKTLPRMFALHSERGFLTITGTYKGVPVSIVSIGMGYPNMDFFVRECREIVEGEMIVVRFGSCGGLVKDLPLASLSVPTSSVSICRNYDYDFLQHEERHDFLSAYRISKPVSADPILHDLLVTTLRSHLPKTVVKGDYVNASADSFYASQGRVTSFPDHNAGVINHLVEKGVGTLEMETFHLLHLASCWPRRSNAATLVGAEPAPPAHQPANGKTVVLELPPPTNGAAKPPAAPLTARTVASGPRIRAAAVQMIFADRTSRGFITPEEVDALQKNAAIGLLEALIAYDIPKQLLHPKTGRMWEQHLVG